VLADLILISLYRSWTKSGQSSHTLLSQVLLLLHYCVYTSVATLSLQTTLHGETKHGLYFHSCSILKNISSRVSINGESLSMLDLLLKLRLISLHYLLTFIEMTRIKGNILLL
jgi:hypothetical protein